MRAGSGAARSSAGTPLGYGRGRPRGPLHVPAVVSTAQLVLAPAAGVGERLPAGRAVQDVAPLRGAVVQPVALGLTPDLTPPNQPAPLAGRAGAPMGSGPPAPQLRQHF